MNKNCLYPVHLDFGFVEIRVTNRFVETLSVKLTTVPEYFKLNGNSKIIFLESVLSPKKKNEVRRKLDQFLQLSKRGAIQLG
jgi:hypothetical protein